MNHEKPAWVSDPLVESWVRKRGLDLLKNGVLFMDKGLRIVYANQSFLDAFKLSSIETIGQNLYELDSASWDIPQIHHLTDETLRSGSHCLNFEIAHRFPRIGVVPLIINAYRWNIAGKGETATVFVVQNFVAEQTEERTIHNALLRSLSQMGEGIAVIQNRRLTFVNQPLCALLGFDELELLNFSTYLEIFHPDERKRIEVRHNARIAGVQFATCYETALTHKNGSRIEVDISVAALLLENKPGVVITIRDITTRKQFELALLESEERNRTFIEQLSDGVCVTVDGHIRFANRMLSRITGYPLAELSGMPLKQLAHEEDRAQLEPFMKAALDGNEAVLEQVLRFCRKGGEILYFRLNHAPIDFGGKRGILTTASDITEQKQMEAKLTESRNRLQTMIMASPVPLLLKRASDNTILFINHLAADMFGLDIYASIGKKASVLAPHDVDELIVQETLNRYGVLHNYEISFKNANGSTVWAIMSEQTMTYDGEKSVLVAIHDITSRKLTEGRLEYLATHDSLTNLPNRKLLFERLQQAILYGERYFSIFAVLYIDLDGFKTINDTLGHAAGDEVLLEASKRMASCVRSSDTVARIGGDEFVILLSLIEQPQQAAGIAEKVIACIQQPMRLNENTVTLGASIGISIFGSHGKDAETLVSNADSAMYKVKTSGKNGFAFYAPSH